MRQPRKLADGTGWVGMRVKVSLPGRLPFNGVVSRMSDGKHLALWVTEDRTLAEHLVYATSVKILENSDEYEI